MSTSKPVPPGGGIPNSYTRFIPREELGSFSAWNMQSLEAAEADKAGAAADTGVRKQTFSERAAAAAPVTDKPAPKTAGARTAAKPAAKSTNVTSIRRPMVGGLPGQESESAPPEPKAAAPVPVVNVEELVDQAGKAGYQDGYRNGLAALESYKQTQAAQLASHLSDQVGALAADFHHRLESLEQQLAGRIAGVALEIARQVVRSELDQRPEAVLMVAEEALGVLLASARQIAVRLNPEDHALAQGSLTEVLQARGARLLPDPSVVRGGCVVESDIAVVDASVEARWHRAAAAMGSQSEWNGGHEQPYSPAPVLDDEDFVPITPEDGSAA
ncbi:MAG: FliH/SctL family protein [Pseudomonadota bacterium]